MAKPTGSQIAADEKKDYGKLIKVMQICAYVFIAGMILVVLLFMKKNNISVKNPGALVQMLQGELITTALMLILFNLVKSFAFVITPSIIFVVSGIVFEDLWVAILVNLIATEIALVPTYYLGKLTGSGMVNALKKRFPKVKKIDDFAGENEVVLSFVLKATGLVPGDTTSLVLGAMNISFLKYFIGASLGALPLNIMWAVVGNKGDLSNPNTLLYVLPLVIFVVAMSIVAKKLAGRKKNASENAGDDTAEETAEQSK